MSKIIYSYFCSNCGKSWESEEEHNTNKCPDCGHNLHRSKGVVCDCGEIVSLFYDTNECPQCGNLFNYYGDKLADPDSWDEQDQYDCFGPQNY